MSDAIDEAGARELFRAARDAIRLALGGPPETRDPPSRPALHQLRATFVTLRAPNGALRGCIGELEARRPLLESVRWCAVGAATRDSRFSPVSREELPGLELFISVLEPPYPIEPSAVEVGKHGLILAKGTQRGVLLPEVAVDQGWDRKTLLAALCRKAQLAWGAWDEPDGRLMAFETRKLIERTGAAVEPT